LGWLPDRELRSLGEGGGGFGVRWSRGCWGLGRNSVGVALEDGGTCGRSGSHRRWVQEMVACVVDWCRARGGVKVGRGLVWAHACGPDHGASGGRGG
jgi:hypothetical protein